LGYEISVTPVQLLTAFSALINGGVLYYPQIVQEQVSPDGHVVFEKRPVQVRRIISEQTSYKIKNILKSVVEKGTGQNAKLEYLSAGGKTGTAQKLIEGSYSSSEYNSSFIGFFPAENPQAVCLIVLNSPKVGKYGGIAAAPIFKKVAHRLIKTDPDNFRYDTQNINDFISSGGYDEIYENHNNQVINVKEPRSRLKTSSSSENFYSDDTPEIKNYDIMPDLTNYNLRNAILVLSKLGIGFKINGSGRIISQSIQPGMKIRKGITCELVCRESDINGAVVY
jgi:cell division protein FtsI (penicillin-binding protein 3)